MIYNNSKNSTIAAVSTPEGQGGIAVIRISGNNSIDIVNKIFSNSKKRKLKELSARKLYLGDIVDPNNNDVIDSVLCTFMKSPNTYTGEDIVEIHCHGGYLVPKKIIEILVNQGVKPAAPGEFTQRSFLNGKMDLAQAEAVSNIISAQTAISLKQAEKQLRGELSNKINLLKDKILDVFAEIESRIDFPEEDIDPLVKKEILLKSKKIDQELKLLIESYETGKIIKDGITTAIIGKPNVGKSSLLNQLLNQNRAIISPLPGTTRDFIEERVEINGIVLRLVDTAGIRLTEDKIEKIGIDLAKNKAEEAEFIIIVIDSNTNLNDEDINIINTIKDKNFVVALNKSDLDTNIDTNKLFSLINKDKIAEISAKKGQGIKKLKNLIIENILQNKEISDSSEVFLTDIRHKNAVETALTYLESFIKLLNNNESPEFLSLDLRSSLDSLGEITGEVTTEDLLGRIFSKFCIGK